MNRFEYTDASGDRLVVLPADGGILVEAENAPFVPLDRVEEVVAGLRDMARQAGGAPPEPNRVVLNINAAPRMEETIRYIVRRGPGEAGMTQ